MITSRVSIILVSITFAACGGAALPPSPPASSIPSAAASASATVPSPETAPSPYTAQEIRQATAKGRTYEYLVESAEKPAIHRIMTFLRATDTEAETRMVDVDAQGHEGAAKTFTATWEELRQHGVFPKASVVIESERITVPAGTFDCARYTVTKGAGPDAEIMQLYFAKTLPGPPVLFHTDKHGTRVSTNTLVRYVAGHD